jgi:hypothetical protein
LATPPTQTCTGLLNVTATATECRVPAAQFGAQSSIFSVPVPVACMPFQADQVMP